MKRLNYLLILLTAMSLAGCGLTSDNGELTGVPGRRKWFHTQPFGTIYVPTGTYHAGQKDQDVPSSQLAQNRQYSIPAFYMDDTEISNNEYRQFVYHVMDSIARKKLGGEYVTEDAAGGEPWLSYKKKLNWNDEALNEMFYQGDDVFFRNKQIDIRQLKYKWQWEDHVAAAAYSEKGKKWWEKNRKDVIRDEEFPIYPDTLVWVRDFTYSFNDPMTQVYFWHPKYDDYPVVGVNWNQARAFCHWRTEHLNANYRQLDGVTVTPFRLPTEFEFEYASLGGRDGNPYPWGGPYVRNTKGCFLANFKPGRGNYIDDGGIYTVKVNAYFPNDYGLYCMSGNVAEWTSSTYSESGSFNVSDLSPEYRTNSKTSSYKDDTYTRKMTRGGSWKDIAYYIQTGTRTQYEYEDSSKSFVGFRCAMSYIGRSNKDKE
jgi:gliding motility-associated lipoprotein GldK